MRCCQGASVVIRYCTVMYEQQTPTRSRELMHSFLLVLAAFIWGSAFVAQAVGATYVGPFTFLALRSLIGFSALFLFVMVRHTLAQAYLRAQNMEGVLPQLNPKTLILGGLCCGTMLFLASLTQQIGIGYTTAGKAGFITTMYVVIVPILMTFMGRPPGKKILLCVVLEVIGLYLLSIAGDFKLGFGDAMILVCAFLFALQIMCINYFVQRIDGVLLSCAQFLTVTVYAFVGMWLFETPQISDISKAFPSILYAGLLSSGIAYTLQIIGQKGLNPSVASLLMCLESVFSALSGFVILHETLTARELMGCALMFTAVVLSQVRVSKGRVQ